MWQGVDQQFQVYLLFILNFQTLNCLQSKPKLFSFTCQEWQLWICPESKLPEQRDNVGSAYDNSWKGSLYARNLGYCCIYNSV